MSLGGLFEHEADERDGVQTGGLTLELGAED